MVAEARDSFGLVGTTLAGKYRVDALVGEGGFGVVYRGIHAGFDEPIAIKCLKLPVHLGADARSALIEQLRSEGRVLFRLSQRTPAIVQALDVGSAPLPGGGEVPYLVMQWVEGLSLAADLSRRRRSGAAPRSLAASVALLGSAARALAIAHAEKVAHRDIKPENLMLIEGPEPTLKVLDFGIAKLVAQVSSADEALTSTAAPVLTAGYAAPEQYEKSRGASGPWSDVFALAIVLLEVASQRRAIRFETLMDAYKATVDPDRRPSLTALGVEAPAATLAVLDKALAVEPRARFRNAGEMWDALEESLRGSGARVGDAVDPGLESTAEFVVREGITVPDTRPPGSADRSAPAPSGGALAASAARSEPTVDDALGSAPTQLATTRGPLVLPPATPRAWGVRHRPWFVGAGLLAAGALAWAVTRGSAPAGPDVGSSVAPSAIVAGTPSAIAVSDNADAVALFDEANAAWRTGSPDAAVDAMTKAVALDRGLAAGQLRLALWKLTRKPAEAREHFDAAQRSAKELDARDSGLLEAAADIMRVPEDAAGYETKLAALAERFPSDADLWALLAQIQIRRLRYDASLVSSQRALDLDPKHVASWVFRGDALAGKGDSPGRLEAYKACVERAPRAFECLHALVAVRASLGQCPEMLEDAKNFVAASPKSPRSHRYLAIALQASGADREAVLASLERSWALLGASDRAKSEAQDRATLALLAGDFDGAEASLERWRQAVQSETDQTSHLDPELVALEVSRELGRLDQAAERAAGLRRKMGSWTEPTTGDWTLPLARYELFAGRLQPAAFDVLRDGWTTKVRDKWSKTGRTLDAELEWTLWVTAWGALALDADSAKAATAHVPAKPSPALSSGRFASVDVMVGRAWMLAGDAKSALGPLTRAATHCSFPMTDPILATNGQLWLGKAYEATGDPARARAAYQRVLERWGAVSASRTAAEARRALAGLPPSK